MRGKESGREVARGVAKGQPYCANIRTDKGTGKAKHTRRTTLVCTSITVSSFSYFLALRLKQLANYKLSIILD